MLRFCANDFFLKNKFEDLDFDQSKLLYFMYTLAAKKKIISNILNIEFTLKTPQF